MNNYFNKSINSYRIQIDTENILKLQNLLGKNFYFQIESEGLTSLALKGLSITNEHLELISEFVALQTLHLNNNKLTSLKGIEKLKNLKYINLSGNNIDKNELLEFKNANLNKITIIH